MCCSCFIFELHQCKTKLQSHSWGAWSSKAPVSWKLGGVPPGPSPPRFRRLCWTGVFSSWVWADFEPYSAQWLWEFCFLYVAADDCTSSGWQWMYINKRVYSHVVLALSHNIRQFRRVQNEQRAEDGWRYNYSYYWTLIGSQCHSFPMNLNDPQPRLQGHCILSKVNVSKRFVMDMYLVGFWR